MQGSFGGEALNDDGHLAILQGVAMVDVNEYQHLADLPSKWDLQTAVGSPKSVILNPESAAPSKAHVSTRSTWPYVGVRPS